MANGAALSMGVDVLRLAGSLLLLTRSLEQQVRAASGEDALTLTELGVLNRVSQGVDTPSSIARARRLDPARVTHITDRLVALGYLERSLDRDDRRRWQLRLTTAGEQRLAAGLKDTRAAMEGLLAGLSPDELDALVLGLEGVRRSLDTPPDKG